MNESEERLAEIQRRLQDAHTCEQSLELRSRTFDGGHVHVVKQCMVCGQQRGGPLSRAAAQKELASTVAPPFDPELGRIFSEERRRLVDELIALRANLSGPPVLETMRTEQAEQDSMQGRADEARAALDKVVDLLDGIPHTGLRFIIQHLQKVHPTLFADASTAPAHPFSNEPELRAWLDSWIAEDFDVLREAAGQHLTERVRVKIDYILSPKAALVEAGFKPGPIGLEVKYLPTHGGFSPRASRFIWQAVSYTDCAFQIGSEQVRLPRVLVFSNISFDNERARLKGIDHSALSNDRAKWNALLELANHANVGELQIYGTREKMLGWRIAFATGVYFRRTRDGYSISDRNLFDKVRVGNF